MSDNEKLKTLQFEVMMNSKLPQSLMDSRGNKIFNDDNKRIRGNKDYIPPKGWFGIGLNVYGKYDNGDNKWLGKNNHDGEWCVAYHGVGGGKDSNMIFHILGLILRSGLKPGANQAHKNCKDIFHQGQNVGAGVYLTPDIRNAENYAGLVNINGETFKVVLMIRVKPDRIRCCSCYYNSNWTLNGNYDEIRPYRILLKKC